MLLNLPNDILAELLMKWVDIRDLCTFDSALSNTNRQLLMSLYNSPFFVINNSEKYFSKYLNWCVLKNIKITTLFISQLNLNLDLLHYSHNTITKIVYVGHAVENDIIKEISQKCKNITSFNISSYGNNSISDDSVIAIAQNFEALISIVLECHNNENITDVSVAKIIQHCKKLKSFTIHCALNYNITYTSMLEVSQSKKLVHFAIYCGVNKITISESLIEIKQNCKKLTSLIFNGRHKYKKIDVFCKKN
jgi:hypothetical protein